MASSTAQSNNKLQFLSEFFLDCPQGANAPPPFSAFLNHLALANGYCDRESWKEPEGRLEFLLWYLHTLHRLRSPHQWPLPAELLEWLNEPALDLTAKVRTIPTLTGDRDCDLKKHLSRFMEIVWRQYSRGFEVQEASGFYGFITWFAYELIPEWNLPPVLLPESIVTLLNLPALTPDLPMSVGMLLSQQRKTNTTIRLGEVPREKLFALAYGACLEVLKAENPRLIPTYVSAFWRSKPIGDRPDLTSFEYVTLKAYNPNGDEPLLNGHEQLTAETWLTRSFLKAQPAAHMLFARSLERSEATEAELLRKPTESAVIIYRDHHTISGIRRAGLQTLEAITALGVQAIDLDFALPRDRMEDEVGHNGSVYSNSKRNLHILALNPEYAPECILNNVVRVREQDYFIGQFYWELDEISPVHDCGIRLVDEIWVSSQFLADVYSHRVDKPVLNMRQALAPKPAAQLSRTDFGLPDKDYLFFFGFDALSIVERKNPLAILKAFRQAFPDGTEKAGVVLKTRNIESPQNERDRQHWQEVLEYIKKDLRIKVISETLPDESISALYLLTDCYISLHRSEGFGFGPAEALFHGKPVITTAYSGVCDFCTQDTSRLVDYDLIAVPPKQYPFVGTDRRYAWASPNIETAARHMRALYDNPDQGRRLGSHGEQLMKREYSLEAFGRRCCTRIAELGF
jgi:glycosyltransferase involved in cell wall biosynthesis